MAGGALKVGGAGSILTAFGVGIRQHRPRSLRSLREPTAVMELFNPLMLYSAFALGALGVALSLPREGTSPRGIGWLLLAIAVGLVFLALATAGVASLPNVFFYVFAIIGIGGAIGVISQPRPVYAALSFILTVFASSGMYLILSATFMAAAQIIIYAGAILITYLFVIMLATESPTAEDTESLAPYDRYSRDPVFATIMGFVLVAALSIMLGRGAAVMPMPVAYEAEARLADVPRRVELALLEANLMTRGERLEEVQPLTRRAVVVGEGGAQRVVELPAELTLRNVEGIAFSLLSDHPGSIEVAGVVLLMAMLGAVVLARKKVEMDERAKMLAFGISETPGGDVAGGGER